MTGEMIQVLREKTGAGLIDCKKALERYNGDITRAEIDLRYRECAINTPDKEAWIAGIVERKLKEMKKGTTEEYYF